MYCQDCNTHNPLDSKYCKECGSKINDGYRTLMLSIQDLPLHQSEEQVEKLTRLLDMAFWHNQAGNTAAAIIACEAALALNSGSTTAHSLLGTLYEKSGDDAKAIHHFESVLALNPDSQADAQKLDQLRRGVHVRAASPPPAHQWVPPALFKLGPTLQKRLAALSGPPETASQRRPLYAAGAATALVLVSGLLLTRPWAQAETVKTYPITAAAPSAPPPASVAKSAFAPDAPPAPVGPPMVLTPAHPNTQTPAYIPPVITARDPFISPPAPVVPSAAAPARPNAALLSLPPVPRRTAAPRRERGLALPPLRLAALPPADSGLPGGIAPAPVALPPGLVPPPPAAGTALSAVPRHTVVVGRFANAPAPSAYSSDLSSHIRITVHQSRDADPADASAPSVSGDNRGESDQQRALSLQEAGSYSQARQAYQSAIHAYQSQIAAGRDVETARRGLSACQTGLQICLQSQP